MFKKLYKFLESYKEEKKIMPSFEEMKDYIKVKSKSVVYNMIGYIEWKGYITRIPATARSIKIIKEID